MYQVITAGKGVESLIGSVGTECREVKHNVYIPDLLDIRITGDTFFVGEDRITWVSFPMFHILRKGNTNSLRLDLILRIDATGIVKHHKRSTQGFLLIPINRAFILRNVFKPLSVFIGWSENRVGEGFPFSNLRQF